MRASRLFRERHGRRARGAAPRSDRPIISGFDSACARIPAASRRRAALGLLGTALVGGVLVVELAGRRAQFVHAIGAAPIWIVALAVLLQLVALMARTEAWFVCVRATGATVGRRRLFRAAGAGSLASMLNGSLGVAGRIASLRRTAPNESPCVTALLAAEVPIITVEIALAALFSFALVSPLGVPWWAPLVAVLVAGGAVLGLNQLSGRHDLKLWSGLAVMRERRGRMVGFVVLAICAQLVRNWLLLRGLGVHISVFDSMALLIAIFTLGQLPIGPALGPAAAVLILGSHGVAIAAAAGVLLTVTGSVGSFCFASWAAADHLSHLNRRRLTLTVAPETAVPVPAG